MMHRYAAMPLSVSLTGQMPLKPIPRRAAAERQLNHCEWHLRVQIDDVPEVSLSFTNEDEEFFEDCMNPSKVAQLLNLLDFCSVAVR